MSDRQGHRKDPADVAAAFELYENADPTDRRAVAQARVRLVDALRADGWAVPKPVLGQVLRDRHLLREPDVAPPGDEDDATIG